MSKYFLLTFNEDYADEHDVPALACFTEEEFYKWKKQTNGELNPNYEEELAIYNSRLAEERRVINLWKEKNLYSKSQIEFTEEEKIWTENNPIVYVSSREAPVRVRDVTIHASLGNSGEYFGERYSHLYLMEEFIEARMVEVIEVDESFYNTFKKANLKRLSLCNIFDSY